MVAINDQGQYIAFDNVEEPEGITTIGYRTMVERFIVKKVMSLYEVVGLVASRDCECYERDRWYRMALQTESSPLDAWHRPTIMSDCCIDIISHAQDTVSIGCMNEQFKIVGVCIGRSSCIIINKPRMGA